VCNGMHAVALRSALAATILAPVAILTFCLGDPFAISAIASTAAVVLHAPARYRQHPQRILWCYAAGVAISGPISLAGAAVGLPMLLAAAMAAIVIVASPAGRVHPPTACIPLAITTPSLQSLALVERWLSFGGLAVVCLFALWLLSGWPPLRRANEQRSARDVNGPFAADTSADA
jgi:hypothetical protein